jgi:hypothetical protein
MKKPGVYQGSSELGAIIKMTKPVLTILLTLVFHCATFGYTRMLYMDQELKGAKLVKEIIVLGYTSRIDTFPNQEPIGINKVIDIMTYAFLDNTDSILTYRPPYTGFVNSTPYFHIATKDTSFHPIVPEGYWPAIGDTVLVVFNSENYVSLFAHIIDTTITHYKFWSPYHTSSWNTIFFANTPFKPYIPTDTKSLNSIVSSKYGGRLQEMAKSRGYEFASHFHCIIDKNDLWTYLEKIEKE